MKKENLFKILVTGGALVASMGATANEEVTTPDAELNSPVFCVSENECEKVHSCSEEGILETLFVVKKGLECCWNTSCDQIEPEEK